MRRDEKGFGIAKRKQKAVASMKGSAPLFTLDVFITSGPMTEEFVEENETICRTIQIRGNQTLEDLHNAIFEAFDREEEHMYEFQIGGKGPMDPRTNRYVLPMDESDPFPDEDAAGTVTATIGSLGLKEGQPFGYWFDFGDDWRHQINVVKIEEKSRPGKYPRVTKRVGESPQQYPDLDDEE